VRDVPAVSHYWPFIVSGVIDGSIYALAAIGLVLTFRISGVFNFAYGAVAAASAYVFYQLHYLEGMSWPLAALITLVALGIGGGLILERIAFWLADAPAVMRVVATVGLLAALTSFFNGYYGAGTIPVDRYLPAKGFTLGGVYIPGSDLITFVLAVVASASLYVFFKTARLGIAMQAVVDDAPLLSLKGSDPVAVRRLAWMIGSCFISVSGMLLAPKLGISVGTLTSLVIAAFGAAAIGAFSSVPLTFVGAIALGIAMNVVSDELATSSSLPLQQFYLNLPFVVLVLALIVIPRRHLIERGVQNTRRVRPPKPLRREVSVASTVLGLAVAVLIPFLVGAKLSQWTVGIAYMVIFASLGLLVWTSGQVSLAQIAFAAVGAATFGHALNSGWPWLLALLVGGLMVVPVAALLAIPAIRLSGIYLAIMTFGFGVLIQRMFFTTDLMFGQGGNMAVERPKLLGLDTQSEKGYYYTALIIALLCLGIVVVTMQSRLGRLLRAYGDSPSAMLAHGANTRVTSVWVFCISAFLAGIGGALLAATTEAAGAVSFDYTISLTLVAVLAASTLFTLGRRSPVLTAIVAAFLFVVLKLYITDAFFLKYQGVGFGLLALGVACVPGMKKFASARPTRATESVHDQQPVKPRSADPVGAR
jgi:branched-subunit amino acid ABC-type transport system permease component